MNASETLNGEPSLQGPPTVPALAAEELAPLHVLRRVSIESVWGLLQACPVRMLRPGDVLLEAGQGNQTMYMVLSGRLSVHLEVPTSAPVAFLGAGETVGEMSVLDDQPASAFVIAAEATRVLAVDETAFWRLVGASHEFATNLLFLLAQRMRANNSAISQGVRERAQFEREAMIDALTNVYNRRWLDDRLPRLVERHRRSGEPLSLLVLDVDHFKRFNDEYGHLAGDQVLVSVGRKLSRCIRPTDLAARYGGEEFVVILPATDSDGAMVVAERLRKAIGGAPVVTPDGRALPPVTASIGVAQLGEGDSEAFTLIDRADNALYRAKQSGRDRVVR